MKNKLIFLFSILLAAPLFAQSDFLQGKLIDAQTIEPVAFATVRVKGRAIGVISNLDGSFRIPQKFKKYGDTLEISSMGYEKRQILISTLPADKVQRIYLQPGVFELQEAVVRAKRKRRLSARAIVRRAIENIPKNYPTSPFSIVGYYRDYQLKKGEYINLNEAILEVYDSGFDQVDSATSKVRIYEYEPNFDFERDTLADNPYNYISREKIIDDAYLFDYHGNEFSILRVHDAIRNYNLGSYSFIYQFDRDLLPNHSFSKEGTSYSDKTPLHKINFQKKLADHQAFGTLYISHGDFAIHKLEYSVYSLKNRKSRKVSNKHDSSGQLLFEVLTEYQKNSDKMYPHYISFHNKFQLLKPNEFRVVDVFWNLYKKRFEILFNREPLGKDATKKDNYSIIYEGYKVKFKTVVSYGDQVWLYPKVSTQEDKEAMAQIEQLADSDELKIGVLSINIQNIRDKAGNLINARRYEDVDQYREFFVQQIKPVVSLPANSLLMDKRKPIFKNQPIHRPENFDDYWMNTPLKNIQ
ncbi:carboxypeptidase-like regulatory domain-containing protein [Allomuricauda sp. SCSIO 65647]|uniref:carboxypeptidase-like regulatory domain-containing protein n=1 Tax=Allomuricauda sp. SCSIO 65647 TaxID=2908843 RepID=UPI001F385702|nr:carboxypeptidase-like regulatory domain-containing protein [Muricauda sp. SCSIO 65647]UJH66743.1 carboxypeptidase-like regulatory domain-containing protein [Muricauda sp. SCSIO 65647]